LLSGNHGGSADNGDRGLERNRTTAQRLANAIDVIRFITST
jgi:hypothetical protein